MTDLSFFSGKTVFLSGHTGFKGSWMCETLLLLGASVVGYALDPEPGPSMFELLSTAGRMTSIIGDVRDTERLCAAMAEYRPEIAIHMAAQPIVRFSYEHPVYTYETNVLGTVNFLEAVRLCGGVRSVVNVTTDKVYQNNEWEWGYRESDTLDGYDPYSNSKSCSELVTASYRRSFLAACGTAVSSCRAGNVIGGGDFAKDRIIPDCVRAMAEGSEILVRNPVSVRPYQHVLEAVCAYLTVAMRQYERPGLQGAYNIGPADSDCVSTGRLADLFCDAWGEGARWKTVLREGTPLSSPHEASFLKLDCSRAKRAFGWEPCLNIAEAMRLTVAWSKAYFAGDGLRDLTELQIRSYLDGESVEKSGCYGS